MRHARKVDVDGLAGNVLAKRHRKRPPLQLPASIFDDLTQVNGLPQIVWKLEANPRLARDRRDDAYFLCRQGHREVIGQASDLGDLGAALGLEFVHCHDRARVNLVDAAADAVGRELFGQELRVFAERVGIDVNLGCIRLVEEAGRRQLEVTVASLWTRRDLQRLLLRFFGCDDRRAVCRAGLGRLRCRDRRGCNDRRGGGALRFLAVVVHPHDAWLTRANLFIVDFARFGPRLPQRDEDPPNLRPCGMADASTRPSGLFERPRGSQNDRGSKDGETDDHGSVEPEQRTKHLSEELSHSASW